MPPNRQTLIDALDSRDPRFDGVFFVGVHSTGIYCRPVCPARQARRDRISFFSTPAEAERDGYRACFRCRPELAPGNAAVDAVGNLVRRAVERIEQGYLNDGDVDALGAELGVTGRHLRRAMEHELGVSPVQLAQTCRLALAKRLLQDTALPIAEIAFSSGFQSVRRFNALFAERFGKNPSDVRRAHGADEAPRALSLRLDFRPPFDWDGLLAFLAARAIPGVERVDGGEYRRVVSLAGKVGTVRVRKDAARDALWADVSLSLSTVLMHVVAKLRRLFDLDARPELISSVLSRDRTLEPLVRARPGLRLPGCVDAFEMTVRAILGQQVTVRGATTLAGRFAERFGGVLAEPVDGLTRRFPHAEDVARVSVAEIAAIGLPGKRAECLRALAAAFAAGELPALDRAADPERLVRELVELPGIGPWTAQYVLMRGAHHPDAFPAGDLGLQKALGGANAKDAAARASAWSPWRSYAVMHLWASLSEGVSK